jgi:integrase
MAKKSSDSDFPLYLHASGQWAKRVLGKVRYFGKDKDAAAKRWLREKDYLLAGEEPPNDSDSATVAELANVFYEKQRLRVTHEKNISSRHVENMAKSIDRLIAIVGKSCHLDRLKPLDWDEIRIRLYEPSKARAGARGGTVARVIDRRSPVTVSNDLRNILVFLNWIQDKKLCSSLNLSSDFRPIGRREARINRAKAGRRDLSASDIRAIIQAAKPNFAPLIWLGINCAAGAGDLAQIEFSHLKLVAKGDSWFDMNRLKTGASRKAWLWPETVGAIEKWLERRPPYTLRPADDSIVFLTSQKMRWVREGKGKHYDSISHTFTKLRKTCSIDRGVFYDLRRTFATVACERSRDLQAVKYIMGHVADKNDLLSDVYNQAISDERINEVCQLVRSWLLEDAK